MLLVSGACSNAAGAVIAGVVAFGLLMLISAPAQASVACDYLEPGQPEPQQCKEEREEEERFFERVEREQREVREREEAERAERLEEERREERERQRQELRERREAKEWAVKPIVTRKVVRREALSLLHEKVPTWTYRTKGKLQCAGGRIDRSHWRCRVNWIAGSRCSSGRLQVIGAGHRSGRKIFRTKLQYASGYGFIENGRIRCFFSDD